MCATATSRFIVSTILVVITTLKERRVVAISLLYSNVTSADILVRQWMESAAKVLVVAFTLALMIMARPRERRRSCRLASCDVSTLLPTRPKIVSGMP